MERINSPELEGPVKLLKLMSPELATYRGVETESPVFVSPLVDSNRRCDACRERFGPLVYQAGYTVESQHFHQDHLLGGGIYYVNCGSMFFEADDTSSLVKRHIEDNGWVGVIDPINPHRGFPRAQAVHVKLIRAFCTIIGHGEELGEGFAVPAMSDWGFIVPVCELTDTQVDFLKRFAEARQESGYQFTYREHSILFSQI